MWRVDVLRCASCGGFFAALRATDPHSTITTAYHPSTLPFTHPLCSRPPWRSAAPTAPL